MSPLIWCALLLFASLALLLLEFLIPSGGVLGLLSGLSCIAALVLAFKQGPLVGLCMIGAIGVLGPAVIALAAKIWPYTPFGRRIIQPAPTLEEVLPDREDLQWMIGSTGTAANSMLPGGIVHVGSRSFEATGIGEVIEAGDVVTVIRIEGQRLMVKKTTVEA